MPLLTHALTLMLAALCLLAGGSVASEKDETGLEQGVKAAYLYNFLSYIEWPPEAFPAPDSPFMIGVAGSDSMVRELRRVTADRAVARRQVIVKPLRPGDSLAGIHLLYLNHDDPAIQASLLEAAQDFPIVTVTNAGQPLAEYSVINFRTVDGRIRFEVSLAAAERCRCRFSARMLSVALQVHPARVR